MKKCLIDPRGPGHMYRVALMEDGCWRETVTGELSYAKATSKMRRHWTRIKRTLGERWELALVDVATGRLVSFRL